MTDEPIEPPQPTPGELARDAALALIEHNNQLWMEEAMLLAEEFLANCIPGTDVTGEDITEAVEARHSMETPKPQCWGALTRKLVNAYLLNKTGRHTLTQRPHNNARETRVYTVAPIIPVCHLTGT